MAPEAPVVQLAPDLPGWQSTFKHQNCEILMKPLRVQPLLLNDDEERVVELTCGWLWAASIHYMEDILLKLAGKMEMKCIACTV